VQSSSQIVTTNKPTPNFLQAGCPSCRPTNNVKAQKGKLWKNMERQQNIVDNEGKTLEITGPFSVSA